MCEEGVQPNDITFTCCMSACSHAGLVDEDVRCYASIVIGCCAKLQHYTCMVDLIGHAGHPQEAEDMVMPMSCKPHVTAWMALLSACRNHGNVEMTECIAKQILEMEHYNVAGYVPLRTHISVRMLNGRERKKVQRNSWVIHGLKWTLRCMRLL